MKTYGIVVIKIKLHILYKTMNLIKFINFLY
jgi:hypothetical protein